MNNQTLYSFVLLCMYFTAIVGLNVDKSNYDMSTPAGRQAYYTAVIEDRLADGRPIYQHHVLLAKNNYYFDMFLSDHLAKGLHIDYRDISAGGDGMTILYEATMYHYYYAIERLLEKGANPFITTMSGESAITKALTSSDKKLQKLFFPYLNKLDIIAVDEHKESIVSKLIECKNDFVLEQIKSKIHKDNIYKRNLFGGKNLYDYAIMFDNPQAIDLLQDCSSENRKLVVIGFAAAVYNASNVIHEITDQYKGVCSSPFLKKLYPLLQMQDKKTGKSPFMMAVERGNTKAAVALLRSLENLQHVDKQGDNVLHYIAKKGLDYSAVGGPRICNADIARIIIPYMNVNTENFKQENSMFNAVRNNLVDLVVVFKENDMAINTFNNEGKTAFMVALETETELQKRKVCQLRDLKKQEKKALKNAAIQKSSSETKKAIRQNYANLKQGVNDLYNRRLSENNIIQDILREHQ